MIGKKLVCCPDGNYISWQDEDYELRQQYENGDCELDFFEFLLDELDDFVYSDSDSDSGSDSSDQ